MRSDQSWGLIGSDDSGSLQSMSATDDFDFSSDDSDNESLDFDNSLSKPFDMELLQQSIETGSKVFDDVTDKNVVLVIGKTGTGKSTLIQGIAGKMLQEAVHTTDCAGQFVEKSVYEAVDALPDFEIGHAKSSQTKSFSCFVAPSNEGNKKTTVYVDTPGFEDTDNQEIDIATSIMLSHIAKKCKTLKFVVLINFTSLLEDRGGAARSVLRFTRAVVKDFAKDKKSFMFLFTHTNEIKGISSSIDSARTALKDEILRLMAGTNTHDADLLKLLDFMEKSLKKGYPFVDILHPVDTDFPTLKRMIELQIQHIKVPTLSTNCGLTGPARHKLSGEITGVLLRTRKHLQAVPPNIQTVLEHQKMLLYLGEHIDLADVQRSVDEIKALIDSFIQECQESSEEEISRGSIGDNEFSFRNAEDLQATLARLDELGAANLTQHFRKIIATAVSEIEMSLLSHDNSRSSWNARNLNKLHSWCTIFGEFAAIYPGVVARFHNEIQASVMTVKEFSCDTDVQEEALSTHIDKLSFLDSVLGQSDQLLHHGLDFDTMRQAHGHALGAITALLSSWREAASDSMETDTLDEGSVKTLLSRLTLIESLQAVLAKKHVFADLLQGAEQLGKDIQRSVSSHFEESCNEIREGDVCNLRSPLKKMRAIVEAFNGIHGLEANNIRHNYKNLVDIIFATLKSELDSLRREAESVSTHGFVNGNKEGQALNRLSDFSWFDEFLLPERSLVSDSCRDIQLLYECRSTSIQTNALDRLRKMNAFGKRTRKRNEKARGTASIGPLKALKSIYCEFQEIDSFALVTENESIQVVCRKVRSEILRYAGRITNSLKVCGGNWECTSTWSPSKRFMLRLNTLLEEVGLIALLTTDSKCQDEVASGKALVLSKFRWFSDEATKVFGSEDDFTTMAHFLGVISAGDEYANIRPHLPSFAASKEKARHAFVQYARGVRGLVTESSEWDVIQKNLGKLESARVLDCYLLGEVDSQLTPLIALRDQKETKVDAEIEAMIRKEDFPGINSFLAPLARSKDQLKRKKFHEYLRHIQETLQLRIGRSMTFFSVGLPSEKAVKKIVENVGKLDKAQREVGKYLQPELPLNAEIKKLKQALNKKLREALDRMESDIQENNLARLATDREEVVGFVRAARAYVQPKLLSRNCEIMMRYTQVLSSVDKLVEDFLTSSFANGQNLVDLLSGLRQASLSGLTETQEMTSIYNNSKQLLDKRLSGRLKKFDALVNDTGCYEDVMFALRSLKRCLDLGLHEHLDGVLVVEIQELIDSCFTKQKGADAIFNFLGPNAEINRVSLASKLGKLDPSKGRGIITSSINFMFWGGEKEYNSLCMKTEESVSELYAVGLSALHSHDVLAVEECVQSLRRLDKQVCKHVKTIGEKATELESKVCEFFLSICRQLRDALLGKSGFQYKSLFAHFRSFVLEVSSVFTLRECQKAYNLTNQLFCEKLQSEVSAVKAELELRSSFDFLQIKSKVKSVRILGGFAADHYALFFEEVNNCDHIKADSWLQKIVEVCHEHFGFGRDFSKMKYFAALGVVPSSSQEEIKRGYKLMAKRHHPDRSATKGKAANAKFRAVREAWEALESARLDPLQIEGRPFNAMVGSIGVRLRERTQEHLKNQNYEAVTKILFQLSAIRELEDLASPALNSMEIQCSVTALVRGHVDQVRIDVKSHWSERKYKELHEDIDDLKKMEKNFKTYPEIFPDSWNNGIVGKVETEIQELGKQARACLSSKQSAKDRKHDFRNLFLRMGFVLVELPTFKHATKNIMSDVLEMCLDSGWGYSYLFELGLSLQKGDDASEYENHVAQLLLSEFSHFKEVMTMVWNEETTQKPVEDTVVDIKGYKRSRCHQDESTKLDIESDELLDSFRVFEGKYKSLLGDYLEAEADLTSLVRKTTQIADQLKHLTCDKGWTPKVKRVIPDIFAGVFALFTVLKSGESYRRLESSEEASLKGEALLMKPHNIQVLALLCMFGCGQSSQNCLESQLLQIRTGEGKSMILGAAATVLGLLGFRVRCVCYSDYLSLRDSRLFEDVFNRFQIADSIKYSKITSLSEDTTAKKGDIRYLTESLLRGNMEPQSLPAADPSPSHSQGALNGSKPNMKMQPSEAQIQSQGKPRQTGLSIPSSHSHRNTQLPRSPQRVYRTRSTAVLHSKENLQPRDVNTGGFWSLSKDGPCEPIAIPSQKQVMQEEILLVDEVDVFFGSEFYGQTYNQVTQLREPEVAEILKSIWGAHKARGRRPRIADFKTTPEYKRLLRKISGFGFLLDNEIVLMLNQVRRVADEPYHLDPVGQRIGYKVMDTISYEVTYGYRTVFAYLQEYDRGNVDDETLGRVLTMPVSCGQFSYADIKPQRILGVSGTLDVMSRYEKDVLTKYGVNTFLFVPSVYGKSNFVFDEAGEGVSIESNKSDFYHKICDEIKKVTKQKRSVIVFFQNLSSIKDFASSPFYQSLGRQKEILSEDMIAVEKDFVITKAATAGRITLCPAVFGRGTDFFCKDGKVEDNGGVHVIQTFFSEERSEEVQIQGRTARQGKQGSYKLVLLEDDLVHTYGLEAGEKAKVPRTKWYEWLCNARNKHREESAKKVEADLAAARKKDKKTHEYFDALLASNGSKATELFKEIYLAMKTSIPSTVVIDLCFAIDVTGSMLPFMRSTVSTLKSLFQGTNSIGQKLKMKFPEMTFKVRVGGLGFRDIDDKENQFNEITFSDGSHFTGDSNDASCMVERLTSDVSGGSDLAEDSLGAIDRCLKWRGSGDWTGTIKCLLLLTDAPAHGLAPKEYSKISNGDSYKVRHPSGVTAAGVVGDLISKDVNLFFCSFSPAATSRTEETLTKLYSDHPKNIEEREITQIQMIPKEQSSDAISLAAAGVSKHIIFVLDESGSMNHCWAGVVTAYQNYLDRRLQTQSYLDLVSVVQFDSAARLTIDRQSIFAAQRDLSYSGGGTCFGPAAVLAFQVAQTTPLSHAPVVVFMSDGGTSQEDSAWASQTFSQLNSEMLNRFKSDLELHVVAFGGGADAIQLSHITRASKIGRLHASADTVALSQIFETIAGGREVASLLESQIAKRISEAVAEKLNLEYLQ